MTGFLVVRDDDTLRVRLARELQQADRAGLGYVQAVVDVLRDVGTPATTERSCDLTDCGHPVQTRLVTEWTEAQP